MAKRHLEQGICTLGREDLPDLLVLSFEIYLDHAVPYIKHKHGPNQHGGFLRLDRRMVNTFNETGLAIARSSQH